MEESVATREDETEETTDEHEHGGEEPASTPGRDHLGDGGMTEEMTLDGAELTGSTPRPGAKAAHAHMSPMESPYEVMRREMKVEDDGHTTVLEDDDSSLLFAQQTARLPDMTMTPQALLQQRNRGDQSSTQKSKDPLLHRILDKNYRLQATPHKSAMAATPLKGKGNKTAAWEDSPVSSPDMAVPTLRTEAFLSPYKNRAARERFTAASQGPRTPGISVQTPMAAKKMIRDALAQNTDGGNSAGGSKPKYEIDWDSDEDDDADLYGGMSPPKTIQFALPPSKLLQTPGKSSGLCFCSLFFYVPVLVLLQAVATSYQRSETYRWVTFRIPRLFLLMSNAG